LNSSNRFNYIGKQIVS